MLMDDLSDPRGEYAGGRGLMLEDDVSDLTGKGAAGGG